MAVGREIKNSELADDFFGEDDDHKPNLKAVRRNERISRNDHAHPVSAMKLTKFCFGDLDSGKKSDADHAAALSGIISITPTKRYPIGTIASYGPNDRKTTKIVAAVFEVRKCRASFGALGQHNRHAIIPRCDSK